MEDLRNRGIHRPHLRLRQIIFFDVRTFKLMLLIVSATLVASAIPTPDLEQSQRAIVGGHYRDIPMF
jgi:hypothetical protein